MIRLIKPETIVSLERSPFLKFSHQRLAFESLQCTHSVFPNISNGLEKIGEEERETIAGRNAKSIETISGSLLSSREEFQRKLERSCENENLEYVLLVSGNERGNERSRGSFYRNQLLRTTEMLQIGREMKRDGRLSERVKFAVCANPNVERTSAEYLENKVECGAELVITQPFFHLERCNAWVSSALSKGLIDVNSGNDGSSRGSGAKLVIGVCAPATASDVAFWGKLVYTASMQGAKDRSAKWISKTRSTPKSLWDIIQTNTDEPIVKLMHEYEQREREMDSETYRDWIFERCELNTVAALANESSKGVHFMPISKIGYDICRRLSCRTREFEQIECGSNTG